MNDNIKAQLSENRFELIVNQTSELTSAQINVEDGPSSISGMYVANEFSDTVSVINPDTNTVIKNITTVGDSPASIDTYGDAVYVTNFLSDTVSVIDSSSYEVVAGIT